VSDYEPLKWEASLGYRVMPDRCRASVHNSYGVGFHQCNRKPIDGHKYCNTHLPENIAARRKASDERYNEKARQEKRRNMVWHGGPFIEALRKIRDGHNDPRTLASEVLTEHGFGDPAPTDQT
jgi:hypothetical protein